jgi:hypothetical protein
MLSYVKSSYVLPEDILSYITTSCRLYIGLIWIREGTIYMLDSILLSQ